MSEFSHLNLDEIYDELSVYEHDVRRGSVVYSVKQGHNEVDQITFLKRNEMRIYIDNFPGQKKYYSSNLPITTLAEFEQDVGRAGITLTKSV